MFRNGLGQHLPRQSTGKRGCAVPAYRPVPQDRRHTLEEHCENLERLVLDLDLSNLTLVLQDLGGVIGGAIDYPKRKPKAMSASDLVPRGRRAAATVSIGRPRASSPIRLLQRPRLSGSVGKESASWYHRYSRRRAIWGIPD